MYYCNLIYKRLKSFQKFQKRSFANGYNYFANGFELFAEGLIDFVNALYEDYLYPNFQHIPNGLHDFAIGLI